MATVICRVGWTKTVDGFRCLTCGAVGAGGAPNICRCVPGRTDEHVDALVRRPLWLVAVLDADWWDNHPAELGPWEAVLSS